MRTGTSTRHQITQLIKSGTPLEILESDEESGYSNVRLPNGKEGWVLSRFLINEPGAREQLKEARRQLDSMKGGQLRNDLSRLSKENRELKNKLTSFRNSNRKLENEIAHVRRVSASAMEIDRENQDLEGQLQDLQTRFQTMEQENASLRGSSARDWFLVGAGVLFAGILLGFIIPKIRWTKKSSWSSL